uniref:SFRICE_014739 n=1 Tax=Spodoptera frugiperda TaxID=7108 RepID=A0A2H1VK16_SPOFR
MTALQKEETASHSCKRNLAKNTVLLLRNFRETEKSPILLCLNWELNLGQRPGSLITNINLIKTSRHLRKTRGGYKWLTRALSPQYGESDAIRFLIGTQSLKPNSNQIHVVELEEDTGALHTKLAQWLGNWLPCNV